MIAQRQRAGLFNGDIGIALERNGELRVWFLMPTAPSSRCSRAVCRSMIPPRR